MLTAAWEEYTGAMAAAEPSPLRTPADTQSLLSLAAGFAGCELIRRTIGAAHVDDLEAIQDGVAKATAERTALAVGRLLVLKHEERKSFGTLLTTLDSQLLDSKHAVQPFAIFEDA